MTYVQQTWANGIGGGTPTSAQRFNYMEKGIFDAHEALATKADRTSRLEHIPSLGLYFPEAEGALADGVNDDGPAITAALAAAAATGGTVSLADGTYLSSALTVPPGVTIEARGATILKGAPTGIFVTMQSTTRLLGVTVDAGGNAVTGQAVLVEPGADDVLIERSIVTDMAAGSSIQVKGATNVRVRYCLVDGAFQGVFINNAASHVTIEKSWVRNHTQRGIYVAGGTASPSRVDILGNWITDMVGGTSNVRAMIQCIGGAGRLSRITVRGNKVIGPNKSYTHPTDPGSADQINCSGIDGLTIEGNLSIFGGDCGISGSQNTKVRITNNDCLYNDTDGIAVGGGAGSAKQVLIVGNTTINNGQNRNGDRTLGTRAGIYLYDAHGVTVSGNDCGDDQAVPTQTLGISVQEGSTDVKIDGGNTALGAIAGLYWDDGTVTVDLQDQKGAAIPTTGLWPVGSVVRNSAPALAGSFGWVCTERGGAASSEWTASTPYDVGECVQLTGPLPGRILVCLVAGTSGTTQPSVGAYGSSVPDGTVTWAYVSVQPATFQPFGTLEPTQRSRLSADVVVNNSTTFIDSGLEVQLEAGAVYEFEGFIRYFAAEASDLSIKFSGPAATTMDWTSDGPVSNATSPNTLISRIALGATSTANLGGAGVDVVALLKGHITAALDGPLSLTFAQFVAGTTDTAIRAGSWIRVTRIA